MPDDKIKISALPSALAFNNTDEFAIVQDNGGSKTTKKGTVQGLGSHIVETMNFSSELDTDSNSIIGAINEAASDKNLAEPYSSTSFYLPGDYCIYNTVLYKCTAASAMEDFDPTKWDEVLITEELGGDMSSKMDKANPTGTGSLAVGSSVSASGNNSTALGTSNTASGGNSHAEGFGTTASALAAHAENDHTTASGASSHAEGYGTIANHASQHVFGECNVADPSSAAATARGNFVEIVGNGANTNNRSNARTLSWDGTETLAADLVFNNATTPQSLTSELQNRYTKAQVDAIIDSILPTDSATGAIASFKTSLAKPIEFEAEFGADANGVSQIKINQTGSNIFNGETESGSFDTTTGEKISDNSKTRSVNPIPVKPEATYMRVIDASLGFRVFFYDKNMQFVSTDASSYRQLSITIPSGCYYMNIAYQKAISQVSINYPSTDTSINPYNSSSNVETISLGSAYYNGGKLTQDKEGHRTVTADGVTTSLPDGTPKNPLIGTNNIWADTGDIDVSFKCSVEDYVNAHAGSGNRSLGVSLSKGAGNGENSEEIDEKTLIDDEEESSEIKPISKK